MWLGDGETSNTQTSTQSGRKKNQKLEPLVPAHQPPPPTLSRARQRVSQLFLWGWGWDGVMAIA